MLAFASPAPDVIERPARSALAEDQAGPRAPNVQIGSWYYQRIDLH